MIKARAVYVWQAEASPECGGADSRGESGALVSRDEPRGDEWQSLDASFAGRREERGGGTHKHGRGGGKIISQNQQWLRDG